MSTAVEKFSCGACGKTFAWSTALAGKSAKCKCGTKIVVPDAPGALARPPSLGYATPGTVNSSAPPTDYDIFEGDRARNLWVPLGMTIGGVLAMAGFFVMAGVAGVSVKLMSVLGEILGKYLLLELGVMLLSLFIIAPMLGVSFGAVPTALLKLTAITLAPAVGLMLLLFVLSFGAASVVIFFVGIVIYFFLFSYFFSLDFGETLQTVLIIRLLRIIASFVLAPFLFS